MSDLVRSGVATGWRRGSRVWGCHFVLRPGRRTTATNERITIMDDMTDSTHFARMYHDGIEAAKKGLTAEDNPYPSGSREALSWQSGVGYVELTRAHRQAEQARNWVLLQ